MSPVSPAVVAASKSVPTADPDTDLEQLAIPDPIGIANDALDADRVATWLLEHPDFFDSRAELLAGIRVRHTIGGRATSLIERQVQVLRDKCQSLETRMAELIRIGQENDAIVERLQRFTRELLRETDAGQLPALLERTLADVFSVPQVAIRLWNTGEVAAPYGDPVSADLRRRVDEMTEPYCGPNSHPEAAGWLPGGGAETASIALMALRAGEKPETFGLLVMGSADPGRYQAGLGTAFLERLGEIAAAALSRLR
jgi:uncharacterized protein YigA (DUF484 family)